MTTQNETVTTDKKIPVGNKQMNEQTDECLAEFECRLTRLLTKIEGDKSEEHDSTGGMKEVLPSVETNLHIHT